MRLIDANALVDEINRIYQAHYVNSSYQFIHDFFFAMSKRVNKAPTVDAVEVVHGRWVQCFEDWREQIEGDKCSACGFEHYGTEISHYHFCPNCGAKMKQRD